MIKIKIIVGSTRPGRFGERPAQWIFGQVMNTKGVEVEMLDLRDYPLPFFEELVPPSVLKEPYKNPIVKKWTNKIADGDAYIIVTPEYNHGYSAVLKNALDYTYAKWNNKPVGFVAYGGAGGVRAVEQLRQVAVELQMVPIRNAVYIFLPMYMEVLKEATGAKPSALDMLKSNADKLIEQLVWWAKTLKIARGQ